MANKKKIAAAVATAAIAGAAALGALALPNTVSQEPEIQVTNLSKQECEKDSKMVWVDAFGINKCLARKK